jgi:hypothetical protein
MDVCIVEAGQHSAPAQVDAARSRTGQMVQIIADGQDTPAGQGHGTGQRLPVVLGVDAGIG